MTTFPLDPSGTSHVNGTCAGGNYGYGTGKNASNVAVSMLSAVLEGGITAGNTASGMGLYQIFAANPTDVAYAQAPTKGTGSGYVLSR